MNATEAFRSRLGMITHARTTGDIASELEAANAAGVIDGKLITAAVQSAFDLGVSAELRRARRAQIAAEVQR